MKRASPTGMRHLDGKFVALLQHGDAAAALCQKLRELDTHQPTAHHNDITTNRHPSRGPVTDAINGGEQAE